jgi:L-iditol 2-dehydrogenase
MLARAQGAGRIIATDINDYKLDAAKRFGADEVIHADEDIPARVCEINGRPVDLVIICTGAFKAFTQALKSVDRGGTILFFAATDPGIELPVPVNEFWRNSITLLPSYGGSPYDCSIAIELIRAKRLAVSGLITHRLPLKETKKGFDLVAESKKSKKVIINPN